MLLEKHPPLADAAPSPDGRGAFKPYPETTTALPLRCSSETVEMVVSWLGGLAGPGWVDVYALANWLYRFEQPSKALRAKISHWVEWLSNLRLLWAACCALMSS